VLATSLTCPAAVWAGDVGGASAPAPIAAGKAGRHGKAGAAKHASGAVTIASAACTPVSRCASNPRMVSLHGLLKLSGRNLKSGTTIAFPRRYGARIARNSPVAHLHRSKLGLVVTVPSSAHSGRIMAVLSHGRHSNAYGPIQVVRYALHPPGHPSSSPPPGTPPVSGSPFDGQGMWIWYVSKSDGGDVAAIVAQAHAAGVGTLYVKSSDGSTNYWSQFSPELVAELHAGGLKVCAWQYVYGSNPAGEAELGARAATNGADCLVIDAEAEYEGRYGAAQTYIADLRAKVGPDYPVGLASFPYVYYHTAEPFSVFLGPGGAQYDLPQMYWKAIGNSVDTVYANTFISNRIYGRPIFPLGQTYESPSTSDILRFRQEAPLYGASGISWWDFQETSSTGWSALAAPLAPLIEVTPNPSYSELSQGSKGDPVLWMQEHLAAAIPSQATTGIFDATTKANLEQFQAAHGLEPSGHTEAATWQALLALPPVPVDWTGAGPKG
jgi:Putative peptidoglycan binding domain